MSENIFAAIKVCVCRYVRRKKIFVNGFTNYHKASLIVVFLKVKTEI